MAESNGQKWQKNGLLRLSVWRLREDLEMDDGVTFPCRVYCNVDGEVVSNPQAVKVGSILKISHCRFEIVVLHRRRILNDICAELIIEMYDAVYSGIRKIKALFLEHAHLRIVEISLATGNADGQKCDDNKEETLQ